MINEELKQQVMKDIVLMKYVGIRPVIVHGGGPDITSFLKKFGKATEFISGLRVTDKETVQIAEMVLAGKINSEIVNRLNRLGVHAVGLSGKDSDLIIAHKKLAEVHDGSDTVQQVDIGYVGEVEKVNTALINDLLDKDYVPVIAPIGAGHADESFNINADYVAAEIAGALQAEKLLLLTDTKGIYRDFEDKSSFISTLTQNEAKKLINSGNIAGGMIPKVEACLHALDSGTGKACIIDGRESHSLILELFTSQGIGTEVVR